MGGKMSRDKGKRWEREVASAFRALFGQQVRRGWQAREGHDAADVDGVPLFRIEAKHHKLVNIHAAVRQSVEDAEKAGDSRWVLAITKSDRTLPLATMLWTQFMQLVRKHTEQDASVVELRAALDRTANELDVALGYVRAHGAVHEAAAGGAALLAARTLVEKHKTGA